MGKHARNLNGQSMWLGLSLTVSAFALAACGSPSSTVTGKFAAPTPESLALKACVAQKLSTMRGYIGADIGVCRRSPDGKVAIAPLTPNFYMGAKKANIRMVQVVSLKLSYAGVAADKEPTPEIRSKSEQMVRSFLKDKCEPQLRNVMKRSGVRARYIYQMHQPGETFATSETEFSGAADFFGDTPFRFATTPDVKTDTGEDAVSKDGSKTKESGKETAKEAKAPTVTSGETRDERDRRADRADARRAAVRERQISNFLLSLHLGEDQGITLADHVAPVSSGPLAATGTEESQKAFCAQLAVRLGEHFGVGGLRDGETCVAPAKTDSKEAAATKGDAAVPAQGLSKLATEAKPDLAKAKLSKAEVLILMKPVCGDVETPTKAPEKSLK